jgi:hypothetical protein
MGNQKFKTEKKKYTNLNDILDYLFNLRLPKSGEHKNEYWSFRGQRDETWGLSITPRPTPNEPFDYEEALFQYKKRMLNDRTLDYMHDKNPWWFLFYAKHHHLHTRLLDWSSNPLVAIYFAVEKILSKYKDDKDSAVWALKVKKMRFCPADNFWSQKDKELIDPVKCKWMSKDNKELRDMKANEWVMVNPGHTTPRIAIQSSKFTFHPGNKPIPLDEMEIWSDEEEQLIKIIIDQNATAEIRKQLCVMNIHHGSLFPSPTGIAHFMNDEWPDITEKQKLQKEY